MDLEIREFEQAIINFANKSMLPIEVKRLALRDICGQLEREAAKEIQRQAEERDKAEGIQRQAEEKEEGDDVSE